MDSIGKGGGLAQTAIQAALQRQAEALARVRGEGANASSVAPTGTNTFGSLVDGIRELNNTVKETDKLPEEMLRGDVQDLHEIAARVKQADITLKYALQVRNKLIDAYREVMRMSV